jgi:hypothetical protein
MLPGTKARQLFPSENSPTHLPAPFVWGISAVMQWALITLQPV